MKPTDKATLSLTTDFLSSTDDPVPHLEAIARAGFTHIHWCHQWNTDYAGDQHKVPFTGTVDWDRLTTIIAASSYDGPISMASSAGGLPAGEFLVKAFAAGRRLDEMVRKKRATLPPGAHP